MKKKVFVLLMLALVVIISGCTIGRIGNLPLTQENMPKGEVTVIRVGFLNAAQVWKVTLDGNEIFGMQSGHYTKFLLNAGEHKIGVKYLNPLLLVVWNEDSLKINIAPESKSYFLISPHLLKGARIESISEQKALKELKDSEYIPFD